MPTRQETWSLKEIDRSRDVQKGTTFRAFKRLMDSLQEGRDFHYLGIPEHATEIEQLRESGRVYKSTVNAVLFTRSGYEALVRYLDQNRDHV